MVVTANRSEYQGLAVIALVDKSSIRELASIKDTQVPQHLYDSKYIDDCVFQQQLLDKDLYKLNMDRSEEEDDVIHEITTSPAMASVNGAPKRKLG